MATLAVAERLWEDTSGVPGISTGPWRVTPDWRADDDTWRIFSIASWSVLEYEPGVQSDVQVFELCPEPRYLHEDETEWMARYVEENDLADTLETVGLVLTEVIGPDAHLERTVRVDPQTGRKEFTVLACYEFSGDEDSLFQRHDRFMKRVVSEIPGEKRAHFVLTWIC